LISNYIFGVECETVSGDPTAPVAAHNAMWRVIVGVFPPAALAWPPCSRSCRQWPLWSPSGFDVVSPWNWRCSPSGIRWPFSVGSGPADRGFVKATACWLRARTVAIYIRGPSAWAAGGRFDVHKLMGLLSA